METFSRRFLFRYVFIFVFYASRSILFRSDKDLTINYTSQFLGVQYFIDLSIIQYATNITQDPSSVNLYFRSISIIMLMFFRQIYLDHFGCPEYYFDEFHSTYAFFIPILISLVFITSFILNVGYIVEERRDKTKVREDRLDCFFY